MSKLFMLSVGLIGMVGSLRAAPPPRASEASLHQEVQELASLIAEEQHSSGLEGLYQLYPICERNKKAPDCRTLVLFNIGNYMGNSVSQYLAMFDPVDADSDYEDLPVEVQNKSAFRAWRFVSVITIDSTGELYATFDGAELFDNTLVLQGFTHGPQDPESKYSQRVTIKVPLVNDAFAKVEIVK